MSDALPLPPRPNLQQYETLATDLQSACESRDADAVRRWAARLLDEIARLQGLETFAELQIEIEHEAGRIEERWHKFIGSSGPRPECALNDAQLFVAREHGFASWPHFVAHVEALARGDSPASNFERAADAIVNGDLALLRHLLHDHPDLVQARSARVHRSTLLHYVSANGVEDFRQKSPTNILEITELLLQSGADVNAESDAYGGRSTTFGLTATSWHPEHAGVQLQLMKLLMDHGAIIDGPDGGSAVNGCLHNGRGESAEFLADHGARLDLEGAAGVGRLDIVKSFFNEDGSLKATATATQLKDGFAWACEFGRTDVVEFLLEHGVRLAERLRHDGETGLHWAAYEGHAETVAALLRRGAPVDAKDESYHGTPLGWALYGWGNAGETRISQRRYYEVVARLVRAGAAMDPRWYSGDRERERALEKMRADPRMIAALRGETPV